MQRLRAALCLTAALCVSAVVFVASDAHAPKLQPVAGEIVLNLTWLNTPPVIRRAAPNKPLAASLVLYETPLTMGDIGKRMDAMKLAAHNDPAAIEVP